MIREADVSEAISPAMAVTLLVGVTIFLTVPVTYYLIGQTQTVTDTTTPHSSVESSLSEAGLLTIQARQGSTPIGTLSGTVRSCGETVSFSNLSDDNHLSIRGNTSLILNSLYGSSGVSDGTLDPGDRLFLQLDDEALCKDTVISIFNTGSDGTLVETEELPQDTGRAPVNLKDNGTIQLNNQQVSGIPVPGVQIIVTINGLRTEAEVNENGTLDVVDGPNIFTNQSYDGNGLADGTYDRGDSIQVQVDGSAVNENHEDGSWWGDSQVSVSLSTSDSVSLVDEEEANSDTQTTSTSEHTLVSDDTPPVTDEFDVNAGSDVAMGLGSEIVLQAALENITEDNVSHYKWEMGDGTTYSGKKASHVYGKSGQYTVILTVEDKQGRIARDSLDVTVSDDGIETITAENDSDLQQAIANASSGDVLYVDDGTYSDITFNSTNITIVTSDTVVFNNSTVTSSDVRISNAKFEDGLDVRAQGVGIYRSTLVNEDGWAIIIHPDNPHVTVQNSHLNAKNGMKVWRYSDYSNLLGSTVETDKYGVYYQSGYFWNGHHHAKGNSKGHTIRDTTINSDIGITTTKFVYSATIGETTINASQAFDLSNPVTYDGLITVEGGSGALTAASYGARSGETLEYRPGTVLNSKAYYAFDIPKNYYESAGHVDLYGRGYTTTTTSDVVFQGLRVHASGATVTDVKISASQSNSLEVFANGVTISDSLLSASNGWALYIHERNENVKLSDSTLDGKNGVFVYRHSNNLQIRDTQITAEGQGINFHSAYYWNGQQHAKGGSYGHTIENTRVSANTALQVTKFITDVTVENSTFDADSTAFEIKNPMNYKGTITVEQGSGALMAASRGARSGDTLHHTDDTVRNRDASYKFNLPTDYYSTMSESHFYGTGYTLTTSESVVFPGMNIHKSGVKIESVDVQSSSGDAIDIYAGGVTLVNSSVSSADGWAFYIHERNENVKLSDSTLDGKNGVFVYRHSNNLQIKDTQITAEGQGINFHSAYYWTGQQHAKGGSYGHTIENTRVSANTALRVTKFITDVTVENSTFDADSTAFEIKNPMNYKGTITVEQGSGALMAASRGARSGDTLSVSERTITNSEANYTFSLPSGYYPTSGTSHLFGTGYTLQTSSAFTFQTALNVHGRSVTLDRVDVDSSESRGVTVSSNNIRLNDTSITATEGWAVYVKQNRDGTTIENSSLVGQEGLFQHRESDALLLNNSEVVADERGVVLRADVYWNGERHTNGYSRKNELRNSSIEAGTTAISVDKYVRSSLIDGMDVDSTQDGIIAHSDATGNITNNTILAGGTALDSGGMSASNNTIE